MILLYRLWYLSEESQYLLWDNRGVSWDLRLKNLFYTFNDVFISWLYTVFFRESNVLKLMTYDLFVNPHEYFDAAMVIAELCRTLIAYLWDLLHDQDIKTCYIVKTYSMYTKKMYWSSNLLTIRSAISSLFLNIFLDLTARNRNA